MLGHRFSQLTFRSKCLNVDQCSKALFLKSSNKFLLHSSNNHPLATRTERVEPVVRVGPALWRPVGWRPVGWWSVGWRRALFVSPAQDQATSHLLGNVYYFDTMNFLRQILAYSWCSFLSWLGLTVIVW
jgi:hypothetical protein